VRKIRVFNRSHQCRQFQPLCVSVRFAPVENFCRPILKWPFFLLVAQFCSFVKVNTIFLKRGFSSSRFAWTPGFERRIACSNPLRFRRELSAQIFSHFRLKFVDFEFELRAKTLNPYFLTKTKRIWTCDTAFDSWCPDEATGMHFKTRRRVSEKS